MLLNLMNVSEKNYNGERGKKIFLEVGVWYLENWHDLHNDLPFSPERMKIEQVKELVANLHDKTE